MRAMIMARALNRTDEQAARILSSWQACRLVPSNDPALREALQRFLDDLVPALQRGEEGLHVRLERQKRGIGRPVHLYAVETEGRAAATLVMNDVHEADGRPRGTEDLRRMAREGEVRFLGDRGIWTNPYWDGRIRSEIIGLHGAIWKHCGEPSAVAARLAWEAATVLRPWDWEWRLRDREDWWTDGGKENPHAQFAPGHRNRLATIRRRAEWLLPDRLAGVHHIPATKLRDRGDASILAAVCHYLVADQEGPQLPWSVAARVLGYYQVVNGKVQNGWRTVYSGVRDFIKAHPTADKPLKGRRSDRYRIMPGRF